MTTGEQANDGPPSPAPQPLRAHKISHKVAAAIVEDIIEQDLKPGDRLPAELEMATRFDVGRASIREGLRLLETFGVIAIRAGQKGGPVVADISAADLGRSLSLFFRLKGATYRDLVDARLVIEPVMAGLAAARQDPVQIERIRAAMERESASSVDNYLPAATDFHFSICGGSGNPVLDLIGTSLRTMYSERLTAGGLFPKEARPRVQSVHQQIGKAILAGDSGEAEKLMGEHMSELAELQQERTPWFLDDAVAWET